MKKIMLNISFLLAATLSFSQDIDQKEIARIITSLSSDEMQGRKIFGPTIDKAADFIAAEFDKLKLPAFTGLTGYKQQFSILKTKLISAEGIINDNIQLDPKDIFAVSSKTTLSIDDKSGFEKIVIDSAGKFMSEVSKLFNSNRNYIVFMDTSLKKQFGRLKRMQPENFKREHDIVFILTNTIASSYRIKINLDVTEQILKNVVAMLPGKSKPGEYVIFSGHYDHIGIVKPNEQGDSICNGANDDASGIAAMIALANYFNKLQNNERTIIFVAFTAEESGGFGSTYFSKQLNPDKVVAMFNIEMIGTESKWGLNSAYITGYEKSDFGKILQQNLAGTAFHFEPDPYPDQKLFYRSDNATLAQLGVPAHTISTSKMDAEKHYHTVDDEIETLDLSNMAEVVKAIAISSSSIIKGTDTPTRVENK